MRRAAIGWVLALGAAGAAPLARGQEAEFSFRAGVEYTSGEYGGTETLDDLYAPLTVAYDARRFGLRLTVPYMRVETLVATIPDPIGSPDVAVLTKETESGVGDVIVGITVYDVARSIDRSFALDITAKIKVGTADEAAGLGTGENDYTVQADLYKFLTRAMLSGTVGRKLRGQPAGFELEDAWFASIGGIYPFSERLRGGVFLDYRESAIPGSEAVREISTFLSRPIGNRWRVQGYLLKGLSDSSADWGGGISVRAVGR